MMSHRWFEDEGLGIYERGWGNGYTTGTYQRRGALRRAWSVGFIVGLITACLCALLYHGVLS